MSFLGLFLQAVIDEAGRGRGGEPVLGFGLGVEAIAGDDDEIALRGDRKLADFE